MPLSTVTGFPGPTNRDTLSPGIAIWASPVSSARPVASVVRKQNCGVSPANAISRSSHRPAPFVSVSVSVLSILSGWCSSSPIVLGVRSSSPTRHASNRSAPAEPS
jgi:hypothetical protein